MKHRFTLLTALLLASFAALPAADANELKPNAARTKPQETPAATDASDALLPVLLIFDTEMLP